MGVYIPLEDVPVKLPRAKKKRYSVGRTGPGRKGPRTQYPYAGMVQGGSTGLVQQHLKFKY
jgi:hypothetical protein